MDVQAFCVKTDRQAQISENYLIGEFRNFRQRHDLRIRESHESY